MCGACNAARPVAHDGPAMRFWRTILSRVADPREPAARLLFDDGAAGMLLVAADGTALRANEALRAMLARRVDLSAGQPASALLADDVRDTGWATLAPVLSGRPARRGLLTRLDIAEPDPEHAAEIAASAVVERDGRASGMLLRVTDLTPRRRLEAQLAHSQNLQAVGQLAGGIAHDFNNLLTAVLGAADLVLARAAIDAETEGDVRQIRASAERGAALVAQILAIGRQQALRPRVLQINDLVSDLASLIKRGLGGGVVLALELEVPGRLVRVDPAQLDRVLINLLRNASDAMPRGGRVTLRTGHAALYRPQAAGGETIPPGRYVLIEVADEGVGIAPDILPRIFEPFFTTRRDQGGTGLGLATVHGIVRQSGGFLTVDSEPGAGTRFRIYLPRHEGEADPAPAPVAPVVMAASAPGSRRVLLVDDEEPVRRLAARALTGRGWTVLACESGDAALARVAAETAPVAAVVSDVVMPGMDGPALVRRLRETMPGLPAILVSGYAEESLRRDLTGERVRFLAKPYALVALAAALEEAVADAAM